MKTPMPLINFNREEDRSATVNYFAVADLRLGDHLEKRQFFFVTTLSHHPIILGIPWLKLHDPQLRFGKETILFNSEYCQKHCNVPLRPTRIYAVPDVPLKDRPENIFRKDAEPKLDKLDIQPVSLRAVSMYARRRMSLM
jgi:hypothetical protein